MVKTLKELAEDRSFVGQLEQAKMESKAAMRTFARTEELKQQMKRMNSHQNNIR